MMSEADRNKAADILMAAEKSRTQAVQLSKTWPDITMEDAYAISTEVAKRKMAGGAKLIGHKVGLTSKAMQRSPRPIIERHGRSRPAGRKKFTSGRSSFALSFSRPSSSRSS